MNIYLGADHRGYKLKEKIQSFLEKKKFSLNDVGAAKYNKKDDYTDFAKKVARAVAKNAKTNRGILLCGSGVGMDIAANKIKGIRAALVSSVAQAKASRHDDNANILVLASDFVSEEGAKKIITAWIKAEFSPKKRYARRLRKIRALERS